MGPVMSEEPTLSPDFENQDIRPTPVLDNPEETRSKLEQWLSAQLDSDVSIPSLTVPEGTGMSNITMVFDATHGGETHSYVARIEPRGDYLVFPEYDLDIQCQVIDMLSAHTDLPVPEIVAKELSGAVLGKPFYIMKKTEGLIPPDIPPYHMDGWLTEQSPETRRQVWNAGLNRLAQVSQVDISKPSISGVLKDCALPGNLDEQLTYWENYYQWAFNRDGKFLPHDAAERILKWLREHQPKEQAIRLCWGDSRMANVIFTSDKTDVAALLDWEMVALGDPLQDLAWWIYMDELFCHGLDFPPLEGFPSRAESVQTWAQQTGYSLEHLHYYLVFAGLRFALLLGRMAIGQNGQDAINSRFNQCFEVKYLEKILSETSA